MVGYADAAIECWDPKYAGPLFDRRRTMGRSVACTGTQIEGPISHYLGGLATVLGRNDEADTYFALAAAFSERTGAKFDAARTNLLWGRMLSERNAPGDVEKAQRLLVKAHTVTAANGYGTSSVAQLHSNSWTPNERMRIAAEFIGPKVFPS
jgi:hypothetical protein